MRPPAMVAHDTGMRAMGGGVKSPVRSCSKSHRICQIRPSTKPTAIATEISRTITSNQVTACSFRVHTTSLPVQKLPDRF
jgi:hypothetical protein